MAWDDAREAANVALFRIFGRWDSEIVGITGLTASTVRSHLKAGRTALATMVGQDWPAKGTP
ncbi:hypothetical protein [Streptomyces sp. UNOB3_S3]|uniref:hypothetical protein n=1 Tax=Streptomyces sp. UNOB3_S3 TaxID=2871682 RepID=UPI001E5CC576|nr:hypothetical protein [Streptomyces sp. UNOB3_S3]MCC3776477.1 hypothetical protein [Streptomyces sp. UNOB3_S3]